ncbi:MAG: hypothetical protein K2J42_08685, partial [Muribaculaceae bacterium]|nr:hypothetical protein [Muribaculaceae bacterium]
MAIRKCPNCGAETQNTICEYCGSEIPNIVKRKETSNNNDEAPRVFVAPFNCDKSRAEYICKRYLW